MRTTPILLRVAVRKQQLLRENCGAKYCRDTALREAAEIMENQTRDNVFGISSFFFFVFFRAGPVRMQISLFIYLLPFA